MSSSTGSFRENKSSELKVKFVDFENFPDTGPDSVTGFFHEIGALNAAFGKRLSQMVSLHPFTPMGETMEEYIRYQQGLEDKYGVKLHARIPRPREEAKSDFPSTKEVLQASTPPSTSSHFPAMDFSKLTKRDAPSPKSTGSDEAALQRGKRKGENCEEPSRIRPPNKENSNVLSFSENQKQPSLESGFQRSGQITTPANGFFSSKPIVKSSEAQETSSKISEKTSEIPKKSLFAGFSLPQESNINLAPAPLNFNAMFGPQSTTATSLFGKTDTTATSTAPGMGMFSAFAMEPKSENVKLSSDFAVLKPVGSGVATFPSFGFGSSAVTSAPLSLGGFSFGNMATSKIPSLKPVDGEENEEAEGEDGGEADPVPVVPAEEQEVAETDALISRRCILFYLDGGAYVKRGVGTAHVKQIEGTNDAVQLLIRAGTSLGAILLNTRITKNTKASRSSRQAKDGKTTESMEIACHATPAFKGSDPAKLYPFTLKFKDATEADAFHKVVEANIQK